jgi:ABC-type branched-subunit amino acid transport system substrate-binding protein
MRRLSPLILAAMLLAACGTSSSGGDGSELLIVVSAPVSRDPFVGRTIEQGVQLAVNQINAKGGIQAGGTTYRFRVEVLDNGLSPQRALDNVRRAVAKRAVAVVDEGTGIDASWEVANATNLPICIVYQGGLGLVDPEARPNVFRIAPTDRGMSFRLAEYLIPKGLRIAFIHDDTGFGQQGHEAFKVAFGRNPEAVTADLAVPSGGDPAPQVLEARRSGATALLVWGVGGTIAQVVRSARSSGWSVPIYTPASGEDPLVRQELSDHPEWVDGLTFAAGRMTAEVGPGPFLAFQAAYEKAFGPDPVGVKTAAGKTVVQPPDYAMYPYDFVNVLAAAIKAAGGPGPRVLSALNQVDVMGANGDNRGFNTSNHEGVVDDDVYFAVFHDMTYRPVIDDPLSASLDVIPQIR